MTNPTSKPTLQLQRGKSVSIAAIIAIAFLWSCWPTICTCIEFWSTNPQYSHGFLVPAFAAFLLWHRRALIEVGSPTKTLLGFIVLAVGCALKLVGAYFAFAWPERISIVVIIPGLVLAVGGWRAIRWSWPALLFLVFMVPLPGRMETILGSPLQRFATVVSTNILQTLGFFAQADGTVIVLSSVDLGIVEACSGLRMLLAFFALTVAMALVIDRPVWQRIALVSGAVPIALICNVGRIVVTAVIYETAGQKWADLVFHDLAGWLMMPAGLGLAWLELIFLSRMFRPDHGIDRMAPQATSSKSEKMRSVEHAVVTE